MWFSEATFRGASCIGQCTKRERKGKKKKKQEQKDTQVLTFNKFFSWEPEITHHMPDAHSQVSQALSTKI